MKRLPTITLLVLLLLSGQHLYAKGNTVIELNSSDFNKITSGSKPVLVKFWASWCGPCRTMAPKFAHVSKSYVGKIIFAELDVDEYSKTANKYDVRSIPTTILFIKGKEMDRYVGSLNTKQIKYWVDAVVKGRYNK